MAQPAVAMERLQVKPSAKSHLPDDTFESTPGALDVAPLCGRFTAESEQKAPVKLPGLPPGAVSNRTGVAGGAMVLLLDALNAPATHRERATPRVAGFLRAAAIRVVVQSVSTGALGLVRIPVTPSPPVTSASASPAGGARLRGREWDSRYTHSQSRSQW